MPRVLIFGTSGIGGALARQLSAKDASIHLLGRSEEKLRSLSASLKNCPFTVVDCSKPTEVESAVTDIAAQGPLAGLVYAVGSIPLKPLKGTTAIDFNDAYNLNFLTAALSVKAAAKALASGPQPGSVVLFSTIAASQGFPNHTAIAASKGAVESFTRSAAAEMAPKVRINCIAPSLTETPLASRMVSNDAMKKALGEAHPLGRLGRADEIAAMAAFLLDHNVSSWVTGQIFAIDGGRSTLRPKN
jgi:NAD(P)-dependent dehydrogenase (short-subunit alcohol dehydrogenase family)